MFSKKKKAKPNLSKNNNADDTDYLDDDYETRKKWYEEDIQEPKNFIPVSEQILIELKDEAKKCHDTEVANYNITNSKTNSNYQWMKTVMSSGTVSDKIAAHIVAIQDNPVCSLDTLTNLVNMVKVGKKKECFSVMENLTELFLSDLLKPNEKLKPFCSKPLSMLNDLASGNAVKRRKILSLWYFEDELKAIYTSFVLALNKAAQDTVDSNKEKALTAMFKLLCGNSEQEKNLLAYIINKLGDPSQKVASKAIYCLTRLLFKHPNMQEVVLKEIEKLLFRANVSTRAQYYSLCFLSQFYLNHEAPHVAKKMIEIYLAFFKACVKKGDVDSRMMSAILMGINRAYPYSKMEFNDMSEHVNTLYRLVHLANFNISLQVLVLLFHVTGENMADRFYAALFRKLVDPKLLTTTHQAMFLSLLYKALLKDTQIDRIKVFVKRLLQISLNVQPSFCCGILYLVSELIGKKSDVRSLILKVIDIPNLSKFEDDDEKYYDIKDEKDLDIEIKTEEEGNKEPIAHSSEIFEVKEDDVNEIPLSKCIQHNEVVEITDIKEEMSDNENEQKPDKSLIEISFKGPSWCHVTSTGTQKSQHKPIVKYNPLARNPLYGGGDFCAYSELCNLKNHFHPTVSLFAEKILQGEKIIYTGDPLKDFTLIRFLDRFVFKNPKNVGTSGAHPTFGKRKFYKPKGVKMLPVNSKSYVNETQKNIPVEEMFLYSYLQRKYQNTSVKENDDSDLESVQSEEFEEMLDKVAGFKDESDDEIDYMNEIGDTLKSAENTKKKKRNKNEDQASEEELEENEDFSEEERWDEDDDGLDANEEDLDLINDLDDDDEDLEFPADSEEESRNASLLKKFKKNAKKGNKDDVSSLFASAEEFASLLEDEGSSKQKPGSSNVFENRDKASQKQLSWEEKRNTWIRGFNKAVKGEKQFAQKRRNKSTFQNSKSKKFKK